MASLPAVGPSQATVMLQAMKAVATAAGRRPFSAVELDTVTAVSHHILHADVDVDDLPSTMPGDLASTIGDPEQRTLLVRLLAVVPYADGFEPNHGEVQIVEDAAAALGVDEAFVRDQHEAALGHWKRVAFDYGRRQLKNLAPERDPFRSLMHQARTQKGLNVDWDLAHRYHRLGLLPEGTVGRAFWEHFVGHDFPFPGEKYSMDERIFTPHDMTHVLSGYDTTPHGEILVMTFTAGYTEADPVDLIMTQLIQFHLGIVVDPDSAAKAGNFQPDKFMGALERGTQMSIDLTAPGWDWWGVMDLDLEELRRTYNVPPLSDDDRTGPGIVTDIP
jgi:hypothetical protein